MTDFKDKVASLGKNFPGRMAKQKRPESPEAELRRLDRVRLMELIVDQRKRIEELEDKLDEAERRLEARTIRLDIEHIDKKEDLTWAVGQILGELEDIVGTD
jgi:small-conductance mechanosensitive channel